MFWCEVRGVVEPFCGMMMLLWMQARKWNLEITLWHASRQWMNHSYFLKRIGEMTMSPGRCIVIVVHRENQWEMTTTFHAQAVRLYGTFSTLDKISPVTRLHDSSSRSSANVDNTLEACFCDSETGITQVVRRHTDLHQIVIISLKGNNCNNSASRLSHSSLTPYLAIIYQENVKMTIFLSTQVQQPEPYKSHD